MPDAHKNFAYSLVATAPSPATSGTSLVVTAGEGTRFPTVPFNATICAQGIVPTPANAEIVRVTALTTDTLTITRTQESSTARSIVVGDQIAATITNKTLTDVEKVVQVVRAAGTTDLTLSSTMADVPGLSLTVTPVSGTRHLMFWGYVYAFDNGLVTVNCEVWINVAGTDTEKIGFAQMNSAGIRRAGISFFWESDAPAGATTYKIRAKEGSNVAGLVGGGFIHSRFFCYEYLDQNVLGAVAFGWVPPATITFTLTSTTYTSFPSGSINSNGTLSMVSTRVFGGSVTASATVLRLMPRFFAGSLTASATLARLRIAYAALSGSITASSAAIKMSVSKGLSAVITGAATVLKLSTHVFSGSSTGTGTLTKRAPLSLAGSTASSGSLARTTNKLTAGSATPTGSILRKVARNIAGAITSSGALRRLSAVAVGGSIVASGVLEGVARLRVRLRVHGKPMLKWLFGPPQE